MNTLNINIASLLVVSFKNNKTRISTDSLIGKYVVSTLSTDPLMGEYLGLSIIRSSFIYLGFTTYLRTFPWLLT